MRLVVIDPTLGDPERSHPYHLLHGPLVARAAAARGDRVVLATHRACVAAADDLDDLHVEPVFGEGVYWRWDRTAVPFQPSPLTLAADELAARIDVFVAGCAALCERVALGADDLVYLPMASEYHLLGLARFLEARPNAGRASWHVQFHFAMPETAHPVLVDALARCGAVRMHLYATTERLASEVAQLAGVAVDTLPRPSSRRIEPIAPPGATPRPLRLTVGGALRTTKMHAYEALVAALERRLAAGEVQIVVQVPASHPLHPRRPDAWRTSRDPLVCAPYPMAADAYAALIRESHVGVFPYDAAAYRGRLSGVLFEMLSAGVPVLVPADCALADVVPPGAGRAFAARDALAAPLATLLAGWLDHKRAATAAAAGFRTRNTPEALLERLRSRDQAATNAPSRTS